MTITAGMVKDLRDKTGAGMMDCKGALAETKGDIEAAIDLLRKKGLAKAAKKGGRIAADGLIGLAVAGGKGAIVEVNSETDFVARGDEFQAFVRKVSEQALKADGNLDRLACRCFPRRRNDRGGADQSDRQARREHVDPPRPPACPCRPAWSRPISTTRSVPISARSASLSRSKSVGRRGEAHGSRQAARDAYRGRLRRSRSARPIVPADVVARERAIYADQARESGKPDNVIEKMVEGRLRKFYEEQVLLSQTFVIDMETQVGKVLENASKELGAKVQIKSFVRFQVGEGIDKPVTDFAAEVKAAAAGH